MQLRTGEYEVNFWGQPPLMWPYRNPLTAALEMPTTMALSSSRFAHLSVGLGDVTNLETSLWTTKVW